LRPVVFKGPLLTQRVFGDLRARASADNDLWVSSDRIDAALGRLLRAGYQPEPQVEARERLRRLGQVALWPRGDFSAVSLDLHAKPFNARYFSVSEELLSRHLVSVAHGSRSFLTFDAKLSLCHLSAHYVQHHLDDSLTPMIGRLYEGLAVEGQLEQVWRLAEETGTREALWLALDRSRTPGSRLHRPRVDPRAFLIARLLPAAETQRRPREVTRKFLALWVSGPGRVIPGILHGLAPGRDELRTRYGEGSLVRLTAAHVRRVLSGH
jgi:hypothetical protein